MTQPKPEPDLQHQSQPIAVTMGDPAGVGLQTVLLAWQARFAEHLPVFVVYASVKAIEAHKASARLDGIPVREIADPSEALDAFATTLPVIPIQNDVAVTLGHSDPGDAKATIQSIDLAVKATLSGDTSAVVTCPITKATLASTGFRYPGHTEYLGVLAERFAPGHAARQPVMLLASQELRVVPLTIHMPLCQVAATLTTDLIIETLQTLAESLQRDFNVAEPRIAVAGLNPHAGENGTIGSEDRDVILPAVVRCRDRGLDVRGPLPADTLFHAAARPNYDAVLCMYHDQALIPIKTLAFDTGVNVTLGLPFVRTSPDHGTALDIAGTDKVSPRSFIESVKLAAWIAENRRRSGTQDQRKLAAQKDR